jgi:hypothetical protein
MPADEDDDVYDDEYDFVDDDNEDEEDGADDTDADTDADVEEDVADKKPASHKAPVRARVADDDGEAPLEADADVYERPAPLANYVVHVYEHQKFKRTMDRPFTAEDAEAFASEYNRTAKPYGRFALAGKDDAKPRKTLD